MKDSYVISTEASRRAARRVSLWVVLAIALGGAVPPSALASTVGVSGTTLSYVGADGEANNVSTTVTLDGASYVFDDPGAVITAGSGCSAANGKATCSGTGVTDLSVETGDMNDVISIRGVTAIPARVDAGAGDDLVTSDNAVADTVYCGEGTDSAVIDAFDSVPATDCEHTLDVAITSSPPTVSSIDVAEFTFSSTDPLATFSCQLDNGPFLPCPSPQSYSGLGEGPHTFAVTATDGGRTTRRVEYQWTVDMTAPRVLITSGASGTTNSTSATFQFLSPDDDATFQCAIDQSDWIDCTSPITYSNLPPGAHTFAVRATDPAGNIGSAAERLFTVVIPAPQTVAPASVTTASSLVLISGNTVKVSKRGFASIALNCSGTRDCAGTLILATSKPVRFSRKRRRIVRLTEVKFFIPAGRTKKVKVHLAPRKIRLIRRLRRVKTDVIVRDLDHAGRARVSTRTVVLRAPR